MVFVPRQFLNICTVVDESCVCRRMVIFHEFGILNVNSKLVIGVVFVKFSGSACCVTWERQVDM